MVNGTSLHLLAALVNMDIFQMKLKFSLLTED